jgi:mRNA-degrading endonuclease RelE of RelBE toxin-antitoxin system
MKLYQVLIDPDALIDIQKATDWYNEQLQGLGTRFQSQIILQINLLAKNHKHYSIRYKEVRCMLIKKFPYLVHFTVDANRGVIEVFAVFHTSRNPKIWLKRKP